jgi:hypothetical protein
MADQAIFTLMEFSLGMAADRVQRVLGHLGRLLVIVTAISCAAFLPPPPAAPSGSPLLFLVLIAIWTVTSSALRAPPKALRGKYVPAPKLTWMTTLALIGTTARLEDIPGSPPR